jgi:hypothetical protein
MSDAVNPVLLCDNCLDTIYGDICQLFQWNDLSILMIPLGHKSPHGGHLKVAKVSIYTFQKTTKN